VKCVLTDSEICWRRPTSYKSVLTKLTRHGV
jgi:hypothetical protein